MSGMRVALPAHIAAVVGVLALVGACADRPTAPQSVLPQLSGAAPASTQSPLIWMAPLGAGAADPSVFDASAAPAVEICIWNGNSCSGSPVARFTTTPAGTELPLVINPGVGMYRGSWNLLNAKFITRTTYRIRVLSGATELSGISVDVTRGRWALTRSDGILNPLAAANILPIRFTIPTSAFLTPEAQATVQLAKSLLTSSDPVAVFAQYSAAIDKLYGDLGSSAASKQSRLIRDASFDLNTDATALNQLNIALGGRTFGGSSVSLAATKPSTAPETVGQNSLHQSSQVSRLNGNAPPLPTTVIYVNGVDTDPTTAVDSKAHLQSVLQQKLGWAFGTGRHTISLTYNPSAAYAGTPSSFLLCSRLRNENQTGGACLFADVAQAGVQAFNIWSNFQLGAQPAANSLASHIRLAQAQGRGVIVVAHSQGNLMAIEALNLLSATEKSCVGIVSVASPSSAFPSSVAGLYGSIAKGARAKDFMFATGEGFNNFTRVSNDLTDAFDTDLAQLESDGYGPLSPINSIKYAAAKAAYDIFIHGFSNSYLEQSKTASVIAADVNSADGDLQNKCVITPPTPLTVSAPTWVLTGQQFSVNASLPGPVTWTVTGAGSIVVPSIVGSSAVVQTAGIGTVTIIATVGGQSASVTVDVTDLSDPNGGRGSTNPKSIYRSWFGTGLNAPQSPNSFTLKLTVSGSPTGTVATAVHTDVIRPHNGSTTCMGTVLNPATFPVLNLTKVGSMGGGNVCPFLNGQFNTTIDPQGRVSLFLVGWGSLY